MYEKTGLSTGHVCFIGVREYFHDAEGILYSANKHSVRDVTTGYRLGAHFECMPRDDNHAEYLTLMREIERVRRESALMDSAFRMGE